MAGPASEGALVANAILRIAVVDDDADVRELVRTLVNSQPDMRCVGDAADGYSAVDLVLDQHPDVILMDIDMPYLNGPRTTERIRRVSPDTHVLAYTGSTAGEAVVEMVVSGASGYVVKGNPDNLVAAIRAAATRESRVDPAAMSGLFDTLVQMTRREHRRRLEVEQLARSLERSLDDTIRALAAALHSRDGYTGEHDDRVARLCAEVGRRLGLSGSRLRIARLAGILHDVGKIGIPDSILHKTSDLTSEEWRRVREHTLLGERILEPVSGLQQVARIVRSSHEHWDGSGYPDGLAGEQIPLEARIVLACDAYDAITTERSYQRAHSHEEAIGILRRLSGSHFDPRVVDELLHVVEPKRAPSGNGHVRLKRRRLDTDEPGD